MCFDGCFVIFAFVSFLKFLIVYRPLMSHLADTFTPSMVLLACICFRGKISHFVYLYSFMNVISKISCVFTLCEKGHMRCRKRLQL